MKWNETKYDCVAQRLDYWMINWLCLLDTLLQLVTLNYLDLNRWHGDAINWAAKRFNQRGGR